MILIFDLPPTQASNQGAIIAAGASFTIAVIGLVAKYLNDLTMQRRKDKLDRLNLQLKHLYGPLYAAVHAGEGAWEQFRERYRRNLPYFGGATLPTEEDLHAWRLWMTEVFMPINLQMEATIVQNADLLIEDEMPECFLLLCAHVAAYKPVLKRWQDGDYRDHLSVIAFPREHMNAYVNHRFNELKSQQNRLLGKMKIKAIPTIKSSPKLTRYSDRRG